MKPKLGDINITNKPGNTVIRKIPNSGSNIEGP